MGRPGAPGPVGGTARRTGAALLALGAQACFFWAGVALWPAPAVRWQAWLALFLVCMVAATMAWASAGRRMSGAGWWYAMLVCLLCAALFCGADGALNALHGPQRAGADVAAHLGGLQLWLVLAPGAASVALACAVRSLALRWQCLAG